MLKPPYGCLNKKQEVFILLLTNNSFYGIIYMHTNLYIHSIYCKRQLKVLKTGRNHTKSKKQFNNLDSLLEDLVSLIASGLF